MNGKQVACIFLVMIVAAVAYGTQMMSKRTSAMKEEAELARADAQTAKGDAQTSDIGRVKLEGDTQELRQFLTSWTPAINRIQSSQDAEQALLSVVRNSGILVVAQKYETKDVHGNPFEPKALQGTLTIQDEYVKTMNWLGELECKIPLIRISTCRMKQGETGRQLNLEVHFEIPLIDLAADLDKK